MLLIYSDQFVNLKCKMLKCVITRNSMVSFSNLVSYLFNMFSTLKEINKTGLGSFLA